eukprot:CAMPEP_0175004302 /NCGR_PEP_ID=MMETSP0005-20121125/4692_1 /TAXON_ID=420556 /ORGANISM="Ochromonas sp., Strain CCMP1393" /LENGTH=64 /DNA_ID=CAMNT_0016259441 /DNA_START=560 /DNA_END=754 /DNA_ORIENTATION=-
MGGAVAEERDAEVRAHSIDELLLAAERWSGVVEDVQDQLEGQNLILQWNGVVIRVLRVLIQSFH